MNPGVPTFLADKQDVVLSLASRNELLRELLSIPNVGNELLPELKPATLSINQVLYEQGDQINYVFFPVEAVISSLAIMEDGTTLETSMIGRESLMGISTVLGSGRSRSWMWVTLAGTALQLESKFLDRMFVQNESALKALLRCYRALVTQVSQRCVCNTRHTILERLACWLLMIHDRVGESNLSLTQEMIASRVGARRAGITVAAGLLQEMRAIEYRRGHLHILNRGILEQVVCECYLHIKAEYPNLGDHTILTSHYK